LLFGLLPIDDIATKHHGQFNSGISIQNGDLLRPIAVGVSVLQVLSDVDEEGFDLSGGPAQNVSKEHQTHSREAASDVCVYPGTCFLSENTPRACLTRLDSAMGEDRQIERY
jgi:hypothetical protein